MSILTAGDITQAEHYTKQTLVKRLQILMVYMLNNINMNNAQYFWS